ncbi:type IV toxin-antitoxin system AbiEi family antitoxin domain-containing protein [Geodermatophilus sabuli]|nr:type IV toxin-antitoxin system AbiEi family antitoxin domain-containing protein [Geodermatophilus sabuli]MBB3084186.1 hypothetical protein [Geodermatophilus sabuli]
MSVDALRQFAADHHGVITDEDAVALGVHGRRGPPRFGS